MAKKKDDFELDEFGFNDSDLNFDFGGTDAENLPSPKDDRKPMTKAGHGFLKGVKNTVFSNDFVKKLVRKSLPREYGAAMDLAGDSVNTVRNLYHTTAKEIKPVMRELKTTTGRVLASNPGKVPKKIEDRLKAWSQDVEKASASMSPEEQRDNMIGLQLADLFKAQAEDKAQDKAEESIRSSLKDAVGQNRHNDTMGQLDGIRLNTQRLSDYQDKIGAHYQRKSLELQFRHYFVAVDMLEEQKKLTTITLTNLEDIKKNTGLPDYVKLQTSERLGEMMRNRFLGGLGDTLFDKRRGFMRNFGNRFAGQVKDKVSGFANDFMTGLSMANTVMDTQDMMKDFGGPQQSGLEMAGELGGGIAADSLGTKLAKGLKDKFKDNEHVRKGAAKLGYMTENAPQLLNEWAQSDKGEGGIFSDLIRMVKDSMTLGGNDFNFQTDNAKDMQKPAVFNNQTRKSINEIIPGFLARIYQELQIMRTGNPGVELTNYDFNTNKFSVASVMRANAFKKIVSQSDVESGQKDVDSLIDKMDPEKKLSAEERQALGRQLLKDNMANKAFNPERYADEFNYSGESSKHATKFADLFKSHFEIGDDNKMKDTVTAHEKRTGFARDYSDLGRRYTTNQDMIQTYLNLGMYDFLRDAGLIDAEKAGDFDQQKLYDYFGGTAQYTPKQDLSSLAGGKKKKKGGFGGPIPGPAPAGGPTPSPTPMPTGGVNISADWQDKTLTVQQDILSAVKEGNVKSAAENISETLIRIEKQIAQGIPLGGSGTGGGGAGGNNKRWYEMSIGDMIGEATTAGKKGFGWLTGKAQQTKNTLFNLGGKALDYGKKGLDWLGEKIDEVQDVYIKGELEPRLLAWKLKAGQYFDQVTGEPIKSLEDIKNTIVDAAGEVVLDINQLRDIQMPASTRIGKGLKYLWNLGQKTKDRILSSAKGFYGNVFSLGKAGFNLIRETLRGDDVYVTGDAEPRLLAVTMRAGGYFSKVSGKPIWHATDIDGPVVDKEGNVLLSHEDMQKGLVDKQGKPFRSLMKKLMDFGMAGINFVKNKFQQGTKFLKDKAKGLWEGAKKLVTGKISVGGTSDLDPAVKVLVEIRNLLDERLPQRKKHVVGDEDGDGTREGSWQEKYKQAKERAGELKDHLVHGGKEIGNLGMAGIAKLREMLQNRKKDKEDKEDNEGSGGDLADAKAGWDLLKDGWAGAKKLGKGAWKHMGRFGRGALGLGSRALGWGGRLLGLGGLTSGLGAGGLAAGGAAAGEATLAGGAAAAGAGATAAGATVAGEAALAGGATAAAGAGGLLASIGAVLASPVVLGALAVAAVGVGAYYAYKHFTKKTLDTLSTVRFAQYGFLPEQTDALQQVFGLEDLVSKYLKYDDNDTPILDGKKFDTQEMAKLFGVSLEDKTNMKNLLEWFMYRFKPVFFTHLTALRKLNPKASLSSVDKDLKPEEKKRYLETTKFDEGPYSYLTSPIPGTTLKTDRFGVQTAYDLAMAKVEKEIGNNKESGVEAGSTVAAAAAVTTESKPTTPAPEAATGTGAMTVSQVQNSTANTARDFAEQVRVSSAAATTVTGAVLPFATMVEKRIEPLDSIRYRTYGLEDMEIAKIGALLKLEDAIEENLSFNAGGVATWQGSVQDLIQKLGAVFGVSSPYSKEGNNWIIWFNSRFLPVYLNYATSIKKWTNKDKPKLGVMNLTAEQKVDTAAMIYTTRSAYQGSNTSVWQVMESPWSDYGLNGDIDSVNPAVDVLKDGVKRALANETKPTMTPSGIQTQKPTTPTTTPTSSSGGAPTPTVNATSPSSGAPWEKVAPTTQTATGANTAVPSSGATTSTVNTNMTGTGGAANALPDPKGNRSWDALKDLIIGASKTVGVDPQMMAIMAAIESGFDYTVKAASSSATGLYQFISGTWDTMTKKYGKKYGIDPSTPPTDPKANALMGAAFLKENIDAIKPGLGREPTQTDLYLAHFLGAGGAKKFLAAGPDAIGANVLPDAARANTEIFYDRGRPRSCGEIYALISSRINQKAKAFGITAAANDAMPASKTPAPQSDTSAPSQNTGLMGDVKNSAPAEAGYAKTGGGGYAGSAAATQAPAANDSSAPVASAPVAPAPSRQINTQIQAQRESFNNDIGKVSDTLQQSLAVQQNQLEVLKSILAVIGNPATNKEVTPVSTEATQAPQPTPDLRRPAKAAPVPMQKAM